MSLIGVTCGPTLEFLASGHNFYSEYCEDDEDFVQAHRRPARRPQYRERRAFDARPPD